MISPLFFVQRLVEHSDHHVLHGEYVHCDMRMIPLPPKQFHKQYHIHEYRYTNERDELVNQGILIQKDDPLSLQSSIPFHIYSPIINNYVGTTHSFQDYEIILSTCPEQHRTDDDFTFHLRFTLQNGKVTTTHFRSSMYPFIWSEVENAFSSEIGHSIHLHDDEFQLTNKVKRKIQDIIQKTPSSKRPATTKNKIFVSTNQSIPLYLSISKYPTVYYQEPTKQQVIELLPFPPTRKQSHYQSNGTLMSKEYDIFKPFPTCFSHHDKLKRIKMRQRKYT